jgi:hypothetical protein
MKKTIILAVLGASTLAMSSFAQGSIGFSSYFADGISSGTTLISFGANTSGYSGKVGTGASSGLFNADVVWSLTAINSGTDAAGNGDLAAGWNSSTATAEGTTSMNNMVTPIANGYISPASLFQLNPYTSGTVYFEIVGYNGSSYANSTIRGHSAEFSATLATGQVTPALSAVYNSWTVSEVSVVPEPGTLALAGLGGLGMLMAFRRKKA